MEKLVPKIYYLKVLFGVGNKKITEKKKDYLKNSLLKVLFGVENEDYRKILKKSLEALI